MGLFLSHLIGGANLPPAKKEQGVGVRVDFLDAESFTHLFPQYRIDFLILLLQVIQTFADTVADIVQPVILLIFHNSGGAKPGFSEYLFVAGKNLRGAQR